MQNDQTEPNNDIALDGATIDGDHRGNGKISRLPKVIRDQVNTLIRDGVSYPEIRRRFLASGHTDFEDISEKNISNWKTAGYQRWLREQEWRDDMLQSRVEALEFSQTDDSKLGQVALKTAAMRLYQLFKQFDAVDFSVSVEKNPEAYTRLFSVLPRITREALRYQKYCDACVQSRAALKQLKDPNRKLSQSETRAIVRHVDSILGLHSIDGLAPDGNDEVQMPNDERSPNHEFQAVNESDGAAAHAASEHSAEGRIR